MAFLCVLCGFLSFGTVTLCCAHGCRLKPLRKRSTLRVFFKLRRAHAVKKIIQADLLCAVNPLTGSIDLAVCLNSRHNCAGGHVHFARLFDDSLQGRPDVALAFGKQPKRVRVPVDAGPVCQPEILSDGRRGAPANEGTFDFFSLRVSADGAIPLVPSKAHHPARRARLAHAAIVVRVALHRKDRNGDGNCLCRSPLAPQQYTFCVNSLASSEVHRLLRTLPREPRSEETMLLSVQVDRVDISFSTRKDGARVSLRLDCLPAEGARALKVGQEYEFSAMAAQMKRAKQEKRKPSGRLEKLALEIGLKESLSLGVLLKPKDLLTPRDIELVCLSESAIGYLGFFPQYESNETHHLNLACLEAHLFVRDELIEMISGLLKSRNQTEKASTPIWARLAIGRESSLQDDGYSAVWKIEDSTKPSYLNVYDIDLGFALA